jgi:hypothetical protein
MYVLNNVCLVLQGKGYKMYYSRENPKIVKVAGAKDLKGIYDVVRIARPHNIMMCALRGHVEIDHGTCILTDIVVLLKHYQMLINYNTHTTRICLLCCVVLNCTTALQCTALHCTGQQHSAARQRQDLDSRLGSAAVRLGGQGVSGSGLR